MDEFGGAQVGTAAHDLGSQSDNESDQVIHLRCRLRLVSCPGSIGVSTQAHIMESISKQCERSGFEGDCEEC